MRIGLIVLLFVGAALGPANATRMEPNTGVTPYQTKVQVRLENSSAHVPQSEVSAALAGAIAAWNAVLPADLRLVLTPTNAAQPLGEVVIVIRFDADPKSFGGSTAIDEAGDTRGTYDRTKNHAIVAVLMYDKAGMFSTKGAPAARDLQIVLTHELGHALGVAHVPMATSIPPLMAKALEQNDKVTAKGTLANLRKIAHKDDLHELAIAMLKREGRDPTGSYTGTLTSTAITRPLQVRAGDLVIKHDAGKLLLDYKGSKRELPAVDLLQKSSGLLIRFPEAEDGRPMRTLMLERGNTPDQLKATMVIKPGGTELTFTGTLTRVATP